MNNMQAAYPSIFLKRISNFFFVNTEVIESPIIADTTINSQLSKSETKKNLGGNFGRKRWKAVWLCLAGLTGLGSMIQTASASGVLEYPIARQYKCYQDGGYHFPVDGSAIPNAACREAFLAGDIPDWQRSSMFIEWGNISQNVAAPDNIKMYVPDGLLCAGGRSEREGLDTPNKNWFRTRIVVPESGHINLRWRDTQANSPAVMRVFITKETYRPATERLRWSDLESIEVNSSKVTQEGSTSIYNFDVTIPPGRKGEAILYSYWQRVGDPSNESFFNCADVVLENKPR